ncbi:hypothetical protein AS203_07440 [Hoylesella enoeca]|uniref:Uncharacterized protein n=1 Tax=Hoylesella enoeca TaxID=76123 RepID=A0A0S2KLE4_9BACT|nr:hypothetical protein AS203_07440 [Hoylesella enoeca]
MISITTSTKTAITTFQFFHFTISQTIFSQFIQFDFFEFHIVVTFYCYYFYELIVSFPSVFVMS